MGYVSFRGGIHASYIYIYVYADIHEMTCFNSHPKWFRSLFINPVDIGQLLCTVRSYFGDDRSTTGCVTVIAICWWFEAGYPNVPGTIKTMG